MEVKFDENLHKYTVDGKEVISVTQLLQKHKITQIGRASCRERV